MDTTNALMHSIKFIKCELRTLNKGGAFRGNKINVIV